MLNLKKRYILNPKYRIRNESIKISIYSTDYWTGDLDKYNCFNPIFGVLLAMFNGEKNYKEVINNFNYVTDLKLSFSEGRKILERYLHILNYSFGESILIETKNVALTKTKRYNPSDFVINVDKIDVSDYRLATPLTLNYDLTFKCFRKCIYCYSENEFCQNNGLLPLGRVKEIFSEAKEIGIFHVILAGGEPFARKDLTKIIEHLAKNNISFFVSTKAYLSEEICRHLYEIGLNKIQVSIDSADEKIADFLAGSKGFLKEINCTLENLLKAGIEIRAKAVITSYNFKGILKFFNFIVKKGIKNIQVTGYGRSIYRHSDKLFLSDEDEKWLSNEVEKFRNSYPEVEILYGGFGSDYKNEMIKEKAFKNRAICSACRCSLNILPDGKVSFCEQLPSTDEYIIGDLTKQSLMEIWNSFELKEMLLPDQKKFENTPCYDCEEFYECNWIKGRCIRDAYNIFRKKYAPDPKCPKVTLPIKMS